MQQEDDLRALAKIMEFGRAVSIFLLVVHVYVYCYPSITAWNLNLEVTDRILVNFNNTTGIFNCILWTKLLAVVMWCGHWRDNKASLWWLFVCLRVSGLELVL